MSFPLYGDPLINQHIYDEIMQRYLITLFRQLEQEQSKNRSQVDEAQVLRHQNQSLRADNAKLMVAVERAQEELENSRQANR